MTNKPSRRDELAKEYGLKVAKYSYERGPMRNIDGSPREFNNRPDFQTESAFRFGYDSAVEDMQLEIEELNEKRVPMEYLVGEEIKYKKELALRDAVISKMRGLLESSRGWCVTHAMQTYSKSADECAHAISECLAEVELLMNDGKAPGMLK